MASSISGPKFTNWCTALVQVLCVCVLCMLGLRPGTSGALVVWPLSQKVLSAAYSVLPKIPSHPNPPLCLLIFDKASGMSKIGRYKINLANVSFLHFEFSLFILHIKVVHLFSHCEWVHNQLHCISLPCIDLITFNGSWRKTTESWWQHKRPVEVKKRRQQSRTPEFF